MKERFLYVLVDKWRKIGSHNGALLIVDLCLLFFAVFLGYALRLTIHIPSEYLYEMVPAGFLFALSIQVAFFLAKLHRVYWLQASVEEFYRMFWAYLFGSLAFSLLAVFLPFQIPRTSLAIFIVSGFLLLSMERASLRLVRQGRGTRSNKVNVFVVGAGQAGVLLVRDLQRSGSGFHPVAFFDDDPTKIDKSVAGVPVLGAIAELPKYVRQHKVAMILIALPSLSGGELRRILETIECSGLEIRVLPGLCELAEGTVTVNRLRKVRIGDLLRREPICLDLQGIESVVKGKTVLVTGAGGSIGSEICLQLAAYNPERLIVLGHGEHSIYTLLESLQDKNIQVECRPVIADVADQERMEWVFQTFSPQVVFHAAAHKHVPLMECNPTEALRVNDWGTWTLARLAGEYGVERMVMISTDKAVNPTSVMGATKRLAELLVHEAQERFPQTAYMAVRFGNVLGSRGSVIPKFERQIEKGGPVTVTDPEMKRYFMLIPEAVSLVLQASALGKGRELFVLDMGEPVKIVDLAEMMIRSHGYEPGRDIPISFTGIRPGEKLFEELFYSPSAVDRTAHQKIFLSRLDQQGEASVSRDLQEFLCNGCETPGEFLKKHLKDYYPNESGKKAVQETPAGFSGSKTAARVISGQESFPKMDFPGVVGER